MGQRETATLGQIVQIVQKVERVWGGKVARNIEIKARITSVEDLVPRAAAIADWLLMQLV